MCPGSPWYGSGRAVVSAVAVDGLFYHLVTQADKSWHHYGRFVRVERASRLEYTWVSASTHGEETLVTVTFEADGDDTRVTLVHTGVPDDEMGRHHEAGWRFVLDGISKVFTEKKKGTS